MSTDFEEKTPCPSCGYGFDVSSAIDGSGVAPTEGDVTICIQCAEIAVFTEEGRGLRVPTVTERAEALTNPEVIMAMFAVRMVRERGQ
jgi:hypothetical protein